MLGSIMQVARVCAPRSTTSKSATAAAGSTALNVAASITKIGASGTTVSDGPVVFMASQDGRLVFGESNLATATAAAGIPIAARTPYVFRVHAKYSYVSWYNAGSATGQLVFWDPEKA